MAIGHRIFLVIIWALYNQRSPAFAPGPLVNNRALGEVPVGSLVECWVEVLFEHSGKEYQVRPAILSMTRLANKIPLRLSLSKPFHRRFTLRQAQAERPICQNENC